MMLKAVAGYGMRQYEKTVLKATWNDDTPTSDEHIDYLVQYSQRPTRGNIAAAIQNRITERAQWKVVLKAIALIHRLIRDGDESFTKDLLHLPKLFTIKDYLDRSTSEAVGESQFIGQYAQYMGHKLHIYDELGYWIEKRFRESSSPMEWISSLPVQELQRVFPLVMASFDKLISCEPNVSFDSVHPIESKVLMMLLKDSLRAYSFLTIAIFYMIDKVDAFDTSVCEWMITQIAHFTKLNSKYKVWAQKLVSLHLVEAHFLPNFETIPTSTIANLQTLLVDRSQQASKSKTRSRSATPKGKSSTRSQKKASERPSTNDKDPLSVVHSEVDLLGLGSGASQPVSKGKAFISASPMSKSPHDNPAVFDAFDFSNATYE